MTKTKTLNERIADTDRTLRAEVENAEDAAETAILRLDKHRYACIKHPDGPKKTQTAYAEIVGVRSNAISQSVKAITSSLEAGFIQLDEIVVPTAGQSEQAGAGGQSATSTQAASHRRSRTKAKHGDERSLYVEALAAAFKAKPGTVGNGNQQHWKDRLAQCEVRAHELAADAGRDPNEDDAKQAAREIKTAYDVYVDRLDIIKKGLTENRHGLGVKVTKAMIDDLYKRAGRLAERTGVDLDEAIDNLLDFDSKETAVDRETARLAATRSYYVNEIEQGLSTMASGGSRVQKAMVAAQGELNLTDDEITTFASVMTRIRGALNALDLLVTGNGDWDAAAAALNAELGS